MCRLVLNLKMTDKFVWTVTVLTLVSHSNGQFYPNMFQTQNPGSQSVPGLFSVMTPNDNKNNGGNVGGWPFFGGLLPPQQQQGGGFPSNFQQGQKQDNQVTQPLSPFNNPFYGGFPGFSNPWLNTQQQQYQQPGPPPGQSPPAPYQHVTPQQEFKNPNWTPPQKDQGGYHQLSYQKTPQNSPAERWKPSSQQSPQRGPTQQYSQDGPPQHYSQGSPSQEYSQGSPSQQYLQGPQSQQSPQNAPPPQYSQSSPPQQSSQGASPQYSQGSPPQQYPQGPQAQQQPPSQSPPSQQYSAQGQQPPKYSNEKNQPLDAESAPVEHGQYHDSSHQEPEQGQLVGDVRASEPHNNKNLSESPVTGEGNQKWVYPDDE